MAFFKFRKGGEEQASAAAAPAPAPESIEAMRRRARYRLAGAFVLVLIGVIGFPLLFDNQPRPIAVDIPIDIPDKNRSKVAAGDSTASAATASGAVGAGISVATPTVAGSAANTPSVTKAEKVEKAEEVITPSKPAEKVTDKAADKVADKATLKEPPKAPDAAATAAKPAAATAEKAATKTPAKTDESARAQALLEGKAPDAKTVAAAADADKGRFVVQFGSFTDVAKAREARQKVERAGMKTYAQVVGSAESKKIRVRVGPFESKAEAEKAAARIKKLELPTAILEL